MYFGEKWGQLNHLFSEHGIKLAYRLHANSQTTRTSRDTWEIAVLLENHKSPAEIMALKLDLTAEMIELLNNETIDVAILDDVPLDAKFDILRQGELLFDPENRHPDYYVKTFKKVQRKTKAAA